MAEKWTSTAAAGDVFMSQLIYHYPVIEGDYLACFIIPHTNVRSRERMDWKRTNTGAYNVVSILTVENTLPEICFRGSLKDLRPASLIVTE